MVVKGQRRLAFLRIQFRLHDRGVRRRPECGALAILHDEFVAHRVVEADSAIAVTPRRNIVAHRRAVGSRYPERIDAADDVAAISVSQENILGNCVGVAESCVCNKIGIRHVARPCHARRLVCKVPRVILAIRDNRVVVAIDHNAEFFVCVNA